MTSAVISIDALTKTYASGQTALNAIHLEIRRGEILALLGPNGAGKTTLINVITGIVNPSGGRVLVEGHDVVADFRKARAKIGLVPQELSTDMFETVFDTVSYSRGLFGKPKSAPFVNDLLKKLSLFEKRHQKIMTLSGGMKRRVLIAKALSHEPQILFLDEPTAGVDVELRRDMWAMVRELRESGVTVILTTHYIEEAEEMADRIGIMRKGSLVLVEEKTTLMKKLGKRRLRLVLAEALRTIPTDLAPLGIELSADGLELTYSFDARAERNEIASLLKHLGELGIAFKDLTTEETSLEEIFVDIVKEPS